MLTTNTTKVRATEDDGKRRVITTTTMKPSRVRFMQTEFPGVNKREMRKIDQGVKFNTTELEKLTNKARLILAKPTSVPAPAIKTPQPKRAKKTTTKKRKAK